MDLTRQVLNALIAAEQLIIPTISSVQQIFISIMSTITKLV